MISDNLKDLPNVTQIGSVLTFEDVEVIFLHNLLIWIYSSETETSMFKEQPKITSDKSLLQKIAQKCMVQISKLYMNGVKNSLEDIHV